MESALIQRLIKLNVDFYQANHESFAQTRDHAWPGWNRVAELLSAPPSTVLDMACGNLRLISFLKENGLASSVGYYAIDSCSDLLPEAHEAMFQQLDIMNELLKGGLSRAIEAPTCDLVACFGLMHHVPTAHLRESLLDALVACAAPSGIVACSFWQFAREAKMRAKAERETRQACKQLGIQPADLEEGDYILGWNGVSGAYRYCHSFSDAEIDALCAHTDASALLVDRFRADGRTGAMNGYVVLRPR